MKDKPRPQDKQRERGRGRVGRHWPACNSPRTLDEVGVTLGQSKCSDLAAICNSAAGCPFDNGQLFFRGKWLCGLHPALRHRSSSSSNCKWCPGLDSTWLGCPCCPLILITTIYRLYSIVSLMAIEIIATHSPVKDEARELEPLKSHTTSSSNSLGGRQLALALAMKDTLLVLHCNWAQSIHLQLGWTSNVFCFSMAPEGGQPFSQWKIKLIYEASEKTDNNTTTTTKAAKWNREN